jgi:hypothetical protein
MTTAAILADPIGYQVRPAPLREPPFEDEQPFRDEPPPRRLGPHDQPLPLSGPSPEAPSRLRLAVLAEDRFEARPTGRLELPEPAAFARRLLIAVIETATGRRSASQLSQHTALAVQAGLARDAGRISRLGTMSRPAAVHSVHLAEPADGVAEVVGIVRVGPRFRAIALRLEAWTAAGAASGCRSADPAGRRPTSACACCPGSPGWDSPYAAAHCRAERRAPGALRVRCAPRGRPNRAPARCR